MLSIHYDSIMMRFFYIDWQQHWECDRTINIGANADDKRTVSTKQLQVTDPGWQTSASPLTVGASSDIREVLSFQVIRLFHNATIFLLLHMYLLFETSPGWLLGWKGFLFFVFFLSLDFVGEHSAPMYLLFAPYTDL